MIDVDKLINDDSIFNDPDCMEKLQKIPKKFELTFHDVISSLGKNNYITYGGLLDLSPNPLPVSLNIRITEKYPNSWSVTLKFRKKRIDGIDYEAADYKNHHSPLGWHRHLNDSLSKTPISELNSIPLEDLSLDTFLQTCFKILNIQLKEDTHLELF